VRFEQAGDWQQSKPQPAAPITPTARDFQHRDLAGEIAERDHVASHGPTGRSSARDTR